jgi:hypothetical protein
VVVVGLTRLGQQVLVDHLELVVLVQLLGPVLMRPLLTEVVVGVVVLAAIVMAVTVLAASSS